MNDVAVQGFWEIGDRESYIENRMKNDKTAAGIKPTRPVASRWFNLMTTIVESSGDVWGIAKKINYGEQPRSRRPHGLKN